MAGIVTQKDRVRLFIWDADASVDASNKVGNITQIGDIGGEAEDIDTTTIESLAKEYENGFEDNGTVDVTQNITSNEYATMAARKDSGEEARWGVSAFTKRGVQTLGLQGRCIVKSVKLTGISVGGLLQCISTLRLNGAVHQDFVDPIGGSSGKLVESITVDGMGGVTTIDEAGGTLQMIATISPDDADNKAVTWAVDASDKAEINSTGLLTAKADGTVTVTATAKDGSGKSGSKQVNISNN